MDRRAQFKEWLYDGGKLLPYSEWRAATNLYSIWSSRVSQDDPRWTTTGGNVEVFVRAVYDWLDRNLDAFLDAVWESGFASKGWRDCDSVTLYDESTIANTANNPGYFRGMCYKEITLCGGDGDSALSIKTAITNTLRGKVRKTFFMPALWKDIWGGTISSNLVLTFNKSCKLASVFSPNVYRYLLRRMQRHGNGAHRSVLFATASWGVPVLAAQECGYNTVHIVDVQGSVLDRCYEIHSDLQPQSNPLFSEEEYYTLGTYTTPSEVMDTVLPQKYNHIISCPPYYDLEMYGASDEQSTTLYKSYSDWLRGYWEPTVRASIAVLEEGGVFAFIMGHHVRYQYMSNDMTAIAQECGLRLVDTVRIMPKRKTEKLYLSPVDKYEVCAYFIKD